MAPTNFPLDEVAVVTVTKAGRSIGRAAYRVFRIGDLRRGYVGHAEEDRQTGMLEQPLDVARFNGSVLLHAKATEQSSEDFHSLQEAKEFMEFLHHSGTKELLVKASSQKGGVEFKLTTANSYEWAIRDDPPENDEFGQFAKPFGELVGPRLLRVLTTPHCSMTEICFFNVRASDLLHNVQNIGMRGLRVFSASGGSALSDEAVNSIFEVIEQASNLESFHLSLSGSEAQQERLSLFVERRRGSLEVFELTLQEEESKFPPLTGPLIRVLISASTLPCGLASVALPLGEDSIRSTDDLLRHSTSPRSTIDSLNFGRDDRFVFAIRFDKAGDPAVPRAYQATIGGSSQNSIAALMGLPSATALKVVGESANIDALDLVEREECSVTNLDLGCMIHSGGGANRWTRCMANYNLLDCLAVSLSDVSLPVFCPASDLVRLELTIYDPNTFGEMLPVILQEQTKMRSMRLYMYASLSPGIDWSFATQSLTAHEQLRELWFEIPSISKWDYRVSAGVMVAAARGMQRLESFSMRSMRPDSTPNMDQLTSLVRSTPTIAKISAPMPR